MPCHDALRALLPTSSCPATRRRAATRHLEIEELFEEELLLVLPRDHPLVDKQNLRPGDLEPYPLVLLDEALCLADRIVEGGPPCMRNTCSIARATVAANPEWRRSAPHRRF